MRLHRILSAVASVATLAVLGLWGTVASALTISPVLVELSPARRVSSITFTNPGASAIRFQTQVLAWTQRDGVDRYEDTDELLVIPPIAEIAAGGSQIFRVTLRAPAGAEERAFRLIFEDVTEAAVPAAPAGESAIEIRVNHNLPVFVAATGKPRVSERLGSCTGPVPVATASSAPASAALTRCVRLDNDGSRYLQVKSLTVDGGGLHKDLGVSTRVLAGAWKEWTFDLPVAVTGALTVKAATSAGPVTFQLPVVAR
ncbi:MAG: fimbria/pilus periplasmic chaperone [Casimicrobiaceae bacterium]